jgi:hypothetical protein
MLDEQVAETSRVDLRVVDGRAAPAAAVQRDPLEGHHGAALGVQCGSLYVRCTEVPATRSTFGFDPGGGAAVEPAGLDQIGDDDPAWRRSVSTEPGASTNSGCARR